MNVEMSELQSIYLFSAFDDEQLTTISKTTRLFHLAEGERLFDHGQPIKWFFYVRKGQIKLLRSSPDGGEKVIEIVRSGETFAEAVMFMEQQKGYPVSAETIEPSVVLAFDQRTMMGILRDSRDTCFKLMANMSRRLRSLVDEIDRLTLHNATFRLVSYLLQQIPEDVLESPQLQLTTPKNVIASRLAIQPETFSRILARLSKDELLEVQGQDIILRNVVGLRATLVD